MTEETQEVNEEAMEQGPEMSDVDMKEFMAQTHQFVTQLHLEQSAVLNVLLKRSLITTDELNEAYQQVREGYQQEVLAKQMQAMGIDPSGIPVSEEQEIDQACAVDVCSGGSCGGRQKPEAHGG